MEQVLNIHQTRNNIIKSDRETPIHPPTYTGQLCIGSTNRVFIGDLDSSGWIELLTVNTPQ